MHVFKIKLQSFEKRCLSTIEDLDNYKIEETCFDDFNITKIPLEIEVDQNYYVNRYNFNLSNSEILNYILHRKIWIRFLEMNIPWCMIIESNVNLNTNFTSIFNTINSIAKDWDIFFPYNAAEFYESNKLNRGLFLLNPNVNEVLKNESYLLEFQWSNSLYFISQQGAKKLTQILTIRERLDDTLLALGFDEKLNIYTEIVNWFDFSNIVRWEYPDRKKLIWDTIMKNSSWTPLHKERVQDTLKVISRIALDLNIDLILQGGTHLGYVRHGGIMPWDDDVDLGIEEKYAALFFKTLKEFGNGLCYGSYIESRTNCVYYKVWNEVGESISNFNYTFPFIDVWIYNIKDNDLIFQNGIICKDSAKHDFISVSFENSIFKIPNNSIDVLDSRYCDWKTKIRVYRYCHRLEKPTFIPLSFSITVNEDGKLII